MKHISATALLYCLVTCLIYLTTGVGAAQIECLSCTYTFAGDGTTDRECVTDARNFTKTSIVSCASMCETRAAYSSGYEKLNSLYRGCGTEQITETCSPKDSVNPACQVTCSSDRCNDQNGDIWQSITSQDTGGNGAVGLTGSVVCGLVPLLILPISTLIL